MNSMFDLDVSGNLSASIEVGVVSSQEEANAVHRLRKEVYVDEYGWVKSETDFEYDEYDENSTSIFTKYNGEVIGTIRVTEPEKRWMGDSSYDGAFLNETLKIKKNCK
ncbi:MAG: GNAT family N-acetyltransferase [Pseudomonadales bacterium]|nr:GNAT family N-acetyltransferase [Pseudomonadales bacterium]